MRVDSVLLIGPEDPPDRPVLPGAMGNRDVHEIGIHPPAVEVGLFPGEPVDDGPERHPVPVQRHVLDRRQHLGTAGQDRGLLGRRGVDVEELPALGHAPRPADLIQPLAQGLLQMADGLPAGPTEPYHQKRSHESPVLSISTHPVPDQVGCDAAPANR